MLLPSSEPRGWSSQTPGGACYARGPRRSPDGTEAILQSGRPRDQRPRAGLLELRLDQLAGSGDERGLLGQEARAGVPAQDRVVVARGADRLGRLELPHGLAKAFV